MLTINKMIHNFTFPGKLQPLFFDIETTGFDRNKTILYMIGCIYPEGDSAAGGERHIVMDFSVIGDVNYYNGMAFEGYIDGIPECVLVGGRYDRLMGRMKKKSRAIGFAVYLDTLAMLGRTAGDQAIESFFDNYVPHDEEAE